jgi:hypothetical protein
LKKEVAMKKVTGLVVVMGLICALVVSGCGARKAETSKAAIETAKAMETTEQKAAYLVAQAKAFYNSEEFQGSVDIAQYVLRYLDRDSQEARQLLEQAKDALLAQTKQNFSFGQ